MKSSQQDILTEEYSMLVMFPPCVDSGVDCAIGVTGNDDVLFFALGAKSIVKDKFLGNAGLSCRSIGELSNARSTAF